MKSKDAAGRESEVAVLFEKLSALGVPIDELKPLKDIADEFVHGGVSASGKLNLPMLSSHTIHYKFSLQKHIPSDIRLAPRNS